MSKHPLALIIIPGVVATFALAVVTYFFTKNTKRTIKRSPIPPQTWKTVGLVKSLNIYPLKSGKKFVLEEAEVTKFGLAKLEENRFMLHDRSFVVYHGKTGECRTAATYSKLLFIETCINYDSSIVFEAPGMFPLRIKPQDVLDDNVKKEIRLLNEKVFGFDCGDKAAKWITQYLLGVEEAVDLRICYHHFQEENKRDALALSIPDPNEKKSGMYANLTAVHLVSDPSLEELNNLILGNKVTADYFRPNILVEGAFLTNRSENHWDWVKIGDCIFRFVKLCNRCIITTINPDTGIRNLDNEPLTTLKKYNCVKDINYPHDSKNKNPVMGIQLEVVKGGHICQEDTVAVGVEI